MFLSTGNISSNSIEVAITFAFYNSALGTVAVIHEKSSA